MGPSMKRRTFLMAILLLSGAWAQSGLRTLNTGREGQHFTVTDYLTRGKTTVVEFASKACPRCSALESKLVALSRKTSLTSFSRVEIDRPGSQGIDWHSPLARQYNLTSLPHFKVYDPSGKLLAEGEAARKMVSKMLVEGDVL